MRRRTRRALVGVAVVPIAAVAILGVEVQLARRGPGLQDDTPLDHDGVVGGRDREPAVRTVWLGDSTAAGVGASDADHAVPRRVARSLGGSVAVTSLAISGATLADVERDQAEHVAALDPDVVLISIGANDVTHLTSREEFEATYDRVLDGLPTDALVVVLGVPDMGAPPRLAQPLRAIAGLRGRQLDEVSRRVASRHGATYVDIAGETGPTMRSDADRYFAEDRYHPSDDGYALWADAVLAQLRPALTAAA